jgi:tetratricopeptide (TPR) repeat protein
VPGDLPVGTADPQVRAGSPDPAQGQARPPRPLPQSRSVSDGLTRSRPWLTALLFLSTLPIHAAWNETKSGPFIVYTDAGDDRARAALYHLEQFRFIFGEAIGRKELTSVWPITVIVSKPSKNPVPPRIGFTRDGWLVTWPAGSTPPVAWFRQLAVMFIEDNLTGRIPDEYEAAMADLFSTMELKGGKVVLGSPPPQDARTKTWALLQYLLTNPESAVRTKVLLSNLANGAEPDAAFRNAFGKPKAAIDAEVEQYLKTGNFLTVTLPGRPLDQDRAFTFVPMLPSRLRVLPGDELMAQQAPPDKVRIAYQNAQNERPGPLGFEGLGLALLAEKQPEDAKKALQQMALDTENAGARGLYELGLLEKDRKLLERAATRNPRWAEPYAQLAAMEPGPIRKAALYKKATELAPRNPKYWIELAKAQFDGKKYDDAEKAWRAAERVAPNEKERAVITAAREQFEQNRYDLQAAEKARLKKEEQDELERVKNESLASIRAAEAAANAKGGGVGNRKVEQWWDGPPAVAFTGTLDAVTCRTGGKATLSARGADGKPVSFIINDPGKIAVFGANQAQIQLSCGPQRPPRRVKIEYVDKPGPKEVVTVELQ